MFFVISGFLITGNILKDQRAGVFTFRRFYVRRVRRLFPALAATLLATLAGGALFFAPDDLARLGQTAFASVVSLSNVVFWRQTGYFDAAAATKPLLHTWSLAVEEQFYLLWPAIVVAAGRFGRSRGVTATVAVIGMASFAAAELLRASAPAAVFYLMPFRMFELCAGGILASAAPAPAGGRWSPFLTVAGLAAIVYSVFAFDASTPGRHFWALLPCAGTALVIQAGTNRWAAALLANPVATVLGTISYSLYLVHWPLVVFYRYFRPWDVPVLRKWLLVVLCIAVAAALYRVVERPFRSGGPADRSHVGTRAALAACAAAAAGVAAIGWHTWSTGGWPGRLPPELRSLPTAEVLWAERRASTRVGSCFVYEPAETTFDEARCLALDPRRPNYLIVGDSFAADAYAYLSLAYPDVNFLQATAGGCPPLLEESADAVCAAMRRTVFGRFLPGRHVDGVVLAAAWQRGDVDALEKTIGLVRGLAPRVVVVGPCVHFVAGVPALLYQSRAHTVAEMERYVTDHVPPSEYEMHRALRKKIRPRVDALIDVQSLLCDGSCRLFTPDRQPIYIDFGHLTVHGARFLATQIAARPEYAHVFEAASASRRGGSGP